jgi:hypothetical protein
MLELGVTKDAVAVVAVRVGRVAKRLAAGAQWDPTGIAGTRYLPQVFVFVCPGIPDSRCHLASLVAAAQYRIVTLYFHQRSRMVLSVHPSS